MAISTRLHAERPRRLRPLTLAVPPLAVLAIGASLWAVSHSSWFDVREMDVRGTSRVTSAEVTIAAAIEAGTSTVWLDEAAVERRLEGQPWIRDAEVTAVWPHTVRIAVVERRPVAIAVAAGERTLVAADGISLGEPDPQASLPEIVVTDVAGSVADPEAVAAWVAQAAEAVGALGRRVMPRLDRVVVGAGGAVELRLSGGVVVRYGRGEDAVRKAAALAEILRRTSGSDPPLERVVLVGSEAPAVTFGS